MVASTSLDGRRGVAVLALPLLTLTLIVLSLFPGRAEGHGKQIQLEISSAAAHDVDPLARSFRVVATYQDGDAVDDGEAELTAASAGSDEIVEAVLDHSDAEPGVFAGTVTFPDDGDWNVTVTIASSSGEGSVDFVQAVAAPEPSPSPDASATATAAPSDQGDQGDQTILTQVTFGFGTGDIANIAIRFLHFLTAVVWTAVIAAVLVGFAWLTGEKRVTGPAARWLVRLTPWLLALMVLSGLMQAVRNAPNTGGITDLATMTKLPFSEVYLGLLAFKSLMYPVLGVLLLRLRSKLKPLSADVSAEVDGAAIAKLAWWSAGVLAAVYAAVLVMNYFHLVSHLAQFYL